MATAGDLLKEYRLSQKQKPAPKVQLEVQPKVQPKVRPKVRPTVPEGDNKSFLDSFGGLTQYLPSVADVTEYAGRTMAPAVMGAYDLLPDHVQEVIKHGIQAGTGIDTGPVTEKSLDADTLQAMKESAWAGLRRTGGKRVDYQDYNIQNPSDALKSLKNLAKTAIDPKQTAGYITGRTDTLEIDEQGNLILDDVYDFMTGKGVRKAWKPKGKEKFGFFEGLMAGREDYENPPSSTTYSKFHNLFDKTGPYSWSGALDTKRPVRINLGQAPPDIKKLLGWKKNNSDPVEGSLGANTQ